MVNTKLFLRYSIRVAYILYVYHSVWWTLQYCC